VIDLFDRDGYAGPTAITECSAEIPLTTIGFPALLRSQ
jgi:hypothetical protein